MKKKGQSAVGQEDMSLCEEAAFWSENLWYFSKSSTDTNFLRSDSVIIESHSGVQHLKGILELFSSSFKYLSKHSLWKRCSQPVMGKVEISSSSFSKQIEHVSWLSKSLDLGDFIPSSLSNCLWSYFMYSISYESTFGSTGLFSSSYSTPRLLRNASSILSISARRESC